MVRTGVIGIGGFGRTHVSALRRMEAEGLATLAAAAQPPLPGMEQEIDGLRAAGVPVYEDWQEMLAREGLEAVTIATPVPLHFAMSAGAFAAGAHVLLEKPPLPSVEKLDHLVAQATAAGRLGAVDFQMLSGQTTRDLKALITSGALGKVRRVTGIGLWKRLDFYYQSSRWHGQLRQGDEWALGGPVANAMGHVLNQCLYFASTEPGFAQPERIEAELYRAHPGIENEDTAAVRVHTDSGAICCFYPTFCVAKQRQPWIELEAENARVKWDYDHALEIRWADGREERRDYSEEGRIEHTKMFRNFFHTIRGEETLLCSLADTRAFTAAATGAYAAGSPVRDVDPAYIERVPDGNSVATLIRGVADDILRAAEAGALFTEAGAPWAGA